MARPRKFDEDRVVEAAMDVFWSKGYAATSPRELCERTGLGRGSVYNAFGSKHELFRKALERYERVGVDSQLAILEAPGPAKERIRELMLTAAVVDPNDPRRRGCLAINTAMELGDRDDEVARQLRRHFAAVEEALRATIERGQREGDVRTDRDARQLARFVMSAYYGMSVLNRTATDQQSLVDIVNVTIDAL